VSSTTQRRQLQSRNTRERLAAARYFADHATSEDEEILKTAYSNEDVVWTKAALARALRRIANEPKPPPLDVSEGDELARDDAESQALVDTTRKLVHELKPSLGRLRLFAQQEVPNFEQSRTAKELRRMAAVLHSVEQLGRAARSPDFEEFNLGSTVGDVIDGETSGDPSRVLTAGPEGLVAWGDATKVAMIVRNGVRNALEASSGRSPVVVNWGATDRDYWIVVLDDGVGLPANVERLFGEGVTNKRGHLGMGLAIADEAARSLGGTLSVVNREDAGVSYEIRWPRPPTDR
jgi:signal transduction histidine kinase